MRNFSRVRRIVVKVGTNLLSSGEGIDEGRVRDICRQIAELKNMGYQVILVSSGAVGLGARELGHRNKVVHIPLRQACAAIGQPILMSHYREAFRKEGVITAQVLLTRNDLNNRKTYNNLRSSVSTLLSLGIVPVFNENDVVSIAEIGTAFGDNDRMSAMVASKIDAQLLVLLTDIDGLYTGNPKKDSSAVLLDEVDEVTDSIIAFAKGAGSTFSTGGMKTKLLAARIAAMAWGRRSAREAPQPPAQRGHGGLRRLRERGRHPGPPPGWQAFREGGDGLRQHVAGDDDGAPEQRARRPSRRGPQGLHLPPRGHGGHR